MAVAFALGRPRRQSILLNLLLGERDSLDDGIRTIVLVAELDQTGLDRLGDQTARRVMIAELINETVLARLGGAPDTAKATVHLGKRRHALADDDRDVILTGDIPDDPGQRLLLRPYFNVIATIAKRAAPVVLRRMPKRIAAIVEGSGAAGSPAFVDDPIPPYPTIEPHLAQQANDGALVFLLGLFDDATGDQLIEHLPHSLRMIGVQNGGDRFPNGLDLGLSAPLSY